MKKTNTPPINLEYIRTKISGLFTNPKMFAEDIKLIRRAFHCSQEEFAKILGVSRGTLYAWELPNNARRGFSEPRAKSLRDIMEKYFAEKAEEQKMHFSAPPGEMVITIEAWCPDQITADGIFKTFSAVTEGPKTYEFTNGRLKLAGSKDCKTEDFIRFAFTTSQLVEVTNLHIR